MYIYSIVYIYIYIYIYTLLLKWYLMPPCLTISIIRPGSRVKGSCPVKGVAPSPTSLCSSFGSPSSKVAKFTWYILPISFIHKFYKILLLTIHSFCIYIYIYIYIYKNIYIYIQSKFGNLIYIYIYISYLPNPSARAGYDTRSIFKRSLTGLNSEFSFSYSCLTKAEEPSLPYYLPIAGGRIIGFIPFPRVLVLCEIQSVSSRIWTRITVSISYDDNDYTTGTFIYIYRSK